MPLTEKRRSTPSGAILLLKLDRDSPKALSEQIYAGIRAAIDAGRLPATTPLPSSRALARDLGVARSM